jgi:hypothetical protein
MLSTGSLNQSNGFSVLCLSFYLMYVKQTEILQTKKNIEQGKGAGKLRVGIV